MHNKIPTIIRKPMKKTGMFLTYSICQEGNKRGGETITNGTNFQWQDCRHRTLAAFPLSAPSEYTWWAEPGSNRRHQDFQSCALPTELSALF